MTSRTSATRLVHLTAGRAPTPLSFDQHQIRIGRGPTCDIVLEGSGVSPLHAVLELRGDVARLIDMGSRDGTQVGGQRVGVIELALGDQIQIANHTLTVAALPHTENVEVEPRAVLAWDEAGPTDEGCQGQVQSAGMAVACRIATDPGAHEPTTVDGSDPRVQATETTPSDTDIMTEVFFTSPTPTGPVSWEVAQFWMDRLVFSQIGNAKTHTVTIDDELGGFELPLLRSTPSGQILTILPEMTGWVFNRGRVASIEQLREAGELRRGDGAETLILDGNSRARLDIGSHSLLVRATQRAAAPAFRPLSLDRGWVGFAVLSLLLHVVFVGLAFSLPPQSEALALGDFSVNDRFVEALVKPSEPLEDPAVTPRQETVDSGGEVAAGDPVEAGRDDINKKTNRRMAFRGDASELNLKRDIESAGALGALDNSVVSSWSNSDAFTGVDLVTAMGGVDGERIGEERGRGGFALFGIDGVRGGGGVKENGFRAAFAPRKGSDERQRLARAAGTLDDRKPRSPKVVRGTPIVSDGLDRSIIQRYVRKHSREVRACYERELTKDRTLAGRVVMHFTITSNGSVAIATPGKSTLGSRAVEHCVASKMRHWVFPQVKGGGLVKVKYPFTFVPQ